MNLEDYRPFYGVSEWVQLSRLEWWVAVKTGVLVWRTSHADGRTDRDEWRGFTEGPDAGKRQQALGSLCERIAAKNLEVYWPGVVNNFGGPDLPGNVEVRLIGKERYGLRVYPRDHDSRRVIGVVVPLGCERGKPTKTFRFRVAGWIEAGTAKRDEWKHAPHGRPPVYFVPQDALRHPAELRRIIREEAAAAAAGTSAGEADSCG